MGEHKHGEMDISVQKETFAGFLKVGIWTTVVSLLILIFLAFVGI